MLRFLRFTLAKNFMFRFPLLLTVKNETEWKTGKKNKSIQSMKFDIKNVNGGEGGPKILHDNHLKSPVTFNITICALKRR